MHSIASVRSSGGAAAYFAQDNYYTVQENAEAGAWGGEGARLAGLSGQVDKDTFEAVLNGRLPGGEMVGQVEGRRLGLDLTFSMPKSASVLALVSGDTRILDAHMAAVRSTMSQLVEKQFAEARNYERSRSGEPEKTGNLVYALFAHDTSRALDPQGHIHAVVANLTRDLKGNWKALWNGEIWKNNTAIGQFYHAALRAQLQKLGYETEAAGKHGSFEIKGVPAEVLKAFSQRREDILSKAEETGISAPKGLDRITVNTRDPKLAVADREALNSEWQDKAETLGFDGKALVAEARARALEQARPSLRETAREAFAEVATRIAAVLRPPSELAASGPAAFLLSASTIKAQHAAASAIRHLSEREAAFSPHAILSAALGFQIKGLEGGAVVTRIGELVRDGHLIPAKSERADGHYDLVTTPAALAREQQILDRIDAGVGQGRAFMAPDIAMTRLQEAARELGKERGGSDQWQLNAGQLAAGVAVLSGKDRFLNIQGVAGAGKSTLLGALDKVLSAEGVKLVGLAFQNKMVADLRGGGGAAAMTAEQMREAGIEAWTIASFVNRYAGPAARGEGERFEAARVALRDTVIITDEASMVSSRDMASLTMIAERLDIAKAPFMGDRQQLSAIEQGKMFAVSQSSGQATVRMDENIRQRGSPLLLAVAGLSNEGHAGLALDLLAAHGRVIEDKTDHVAAAADLWLSLPPSERARTAIFTAGRDDRARINGLVQQGLLKDGTLTGDGVALATLQSVNATREEMRFVSTYRTGQVLEARMEVRELGLKRGEYDVVAIGKDGKVTLERDGRRKAIDPDRIDPNHRFDRLGLHERKDVMLHDGETILWREKDGARDIAKSTYARVIAARPEAVTVELADKRQLTLPSGDPMLRRLDLGYALNAHMAQGITQAQAIEVISSSQRNLATQRTQNVLNTRATDDMRVVTNDLEALKFQLDRTPGNKTSALEVVGRLDVDPKPANPIETRQLPELKMSPELKAKLDAVLGPVAELAVRQLPVPEKSLGLDL
ncbi:conjugative relaxase-like TrwC/TraI family protein [Novosphingobium hassiacum]|uniref:Conjugative relaxase-like TrwC/TraI family protein n=1 Tax=Novosphingobium hassiacum TaxID=173676 RepID=A0A7W6A178_9SPHN|nr:MobF family relaxase [Novosphingobium hassiacum]MBB3862319.1 conjugative relaxase-like TrwC/TraI family protein [Novosphingobium hassiacum]